MAPQTKFFKDKDFMKELDLPDYFNEIDPQEENTYKLRNLVDFEITDSNGNVVEFEDLATCTDKSNLTVRGLCIEPLDYTVRQTLLNVSSSAKSDGPVTSAAGKRKAEDISNGNSSSSSCSENNSDDKPITESSSQESCPPVELDRSTLKVGSLIDGYCNRTFQWFPAKVVEVLGDGSGSDDVKIHFQGWNSQYDEWMSRDSDRLVASGTSKKVEIFNAKNAADMVPWFKTKELYAKMQSKCPDAGKSSHPYPDGRLSSTTRSQRVIITGALDWCIDLTYCSPSIWLISPNEIWYRVAGIFSPCGHYGFPSQRYAPAFDPFIQKFEATAHAAFVLLDFYGQNPKISVQDVVAEIVARSEGVVSEGVVLLAHDMICKQISELGQSEEWNKKLKPLNQSQFIYQLQRWGPASLNSVQWQPKKPIRKQVVNKGEASGKLEAMLEGRGRRQNILFQYLLTKPSNIKFPIIDGDLWDIEFYRQVLPKPMPIPVSSPQIEVPNVDVFHILQTWSMCMNYREPLGLPYISLNRFMKDFNLDDSNPQPMSKLMRELHCRILANVLVDGNFGLAQSALSIFEFFPILNCDAMQSYDDAGNGTLLTGPFLALHSANKQSPSQNQHYLEQICILLRGADTWVEVLRMLLSLREHVQLEEYSDPIAGCLEALLDLMSFPKADAFLRPIKPTDDGVPDYHERVKTPMDLTTIRSRISQGWYDPPVSSAEDPNLIDESKDDTRFGGVTGILTDISKVWSNCYKYWDPVPFVGDETEHPVVELAKACEAKFQYSFASKVLGMSKEEIDVLDSDDTPLELHKNVAKLNTTKTKSEKNENRFKFVKKEGAVPKFGLSSTVSGDMFAKDADQDWKSHVAEINDAAQYEMVPSNVRLQIFRWLLKQYVATAIAREHANVIDGGGGDDDVQEKEKPVDEEPKPKAKRIRRSKAQIEADAKAAAEEKEQKAREKAEAIAAALAAGLPPPENPDKKKPRKRASPKPKVKKGGEGAAAAEEEDDNAIKGRNRSTKTFETDLDGNIRHSRLVPIGGDRHGHRYWAFCFTGPPPPPAPATTTTAASAANTDDTVKMEVSDGIDEGKTTTNVESMMPENSANAAAGEVYVPEPVPALELGADAHRIFCENPLTGKWSCYSTKLDLNILLGWLDPRGKAEGKTRQFLLEWGENNKLPIMLPPQLGQPIFTQNPVSPIKVTPITMKKNVTVADAETESEDDGHSKKRIKAEIKTVEVSLSSVSSSTAETEKNSDTMEEVPPQTESEHMTLSYADFGLPPPVAENKGDNNSTESKPILSEQAQLIQAQRLAEEKRQKEAFKVAVSEYESFLAKPSSFDKPEESDQDLSMVNLDYWHHFEQTSVLYNCKLVLTGSLGMAVKESSDVIKGRSVLCIGYAGPPGSSSAAEMAGICIGDRILSCNKHPVSSIPALQAAVGAAKKAAKEDETVILNIMVARVSASLAWLPPQYSDDALQTAATTYTIDMTDFPEKINVPCRTAGLIADVVFRCQNREYFPASVIEKYIASFTDILIDDSETEEKLRVEDMMKKLKGVLLAAEEAMVAATKNNRNRKTMRELNALWLGDERLRYQWRRIVNEATNWGKLSTCATILGMNITRPLLPYPKLDGYD
jgi:hypothetical protein